MDEIPSMPDGNISVLPEQQALKLTLGINKAAMTIMIPVAEYNSEVNTWWRKLIQESLRAIHQKAEK